MIPWSRVAVDREDFWRWPGGAAHPRARFQEWQHFVVFGDGIDLIVNFSVRVPAGGVAPDEARLVVLARDDRWWGFIDEVDPGAVIAGADGREVRFPQGRTSVQADGYRVQVSSPEHDVALDLTLRPAALPMVVRRSEITPGRRLDWVVVPRLTVEGTARAGDRTRALDGATAYHDHNWGCFDWGDDYTWEWGALLAEGDGAPLSVLYSAGMNRARTRLHYEYAVVWQGAETALSASGPDVVTRWSDRHAAPASLRLPGVMALLRPRRDRDLPGSVTVEARNGPDRVEARFGVESSAEIIIPSDGDPLGSLGLHECVGAAEIDAVLGGRPVRQKGRGVFEFVRG
jgi:hypothetical protein